MQLARFLLKFPVLPLEVLQIAEDDVHCDKVDVISVFPTGINLDPAAAGCVSD